MVARMAGVPILPIGVAAKRSWRAPTWDRHLVPKIFSRVLITVGEPIEVPRKLDEQQIEVFRQELESEVNRLTGMCEARLGVRTGTPSSSHGRREEDS